MFPNPATHQVNVELPEGIKNDFYVRVFDVSGKRVLEEQQSVAGIQKTFSLDISGLPSGMYHVEVSDGARKALGTIIKR